jgi:hypothetical protein
MPPGSSPTCRSHWARHAVPALLIACVLVVLFWEVMAHRSARPFAPFDLTAADFAGFEPRLAGWQVRPVPVATNDPVEPNIFALRAVRAGAAYGVRVVHGYNMPMCMKIKGYTTEEFGVQGSGFRMGEGGEEHSESAAGIPAEGSPLNPEPRTPNLEPTPEARPQLWRVVSSVGDVSVWVTSMIRAGDFRVTAVDCRSMPFPRATVQEDPGWIPRGLSWSSLRHPVAGLRTYLRSRWNTSRSDLATFLRLRQPAWASEELLTLVVYTLGDPLPPGAERAAAAEALALHDGLLLELQRWRAATTAGR